MLVFCTRKCGDAVAGGAAADPATAVRFGADFIHRVLSLCSLTHPLSPSYQIVAAARMAFVVSEGLLGSNCEFCGELLEHAQRTRRFQALQQQLAGDGGAGSLGLVHLSDEWTTSATW